MVERYRVTVTRNTVCAREEVSFHLQANALNTGTARSTDRVERIVLAEAPFARVDCIAEVEVTLTVVKFCAKNKKKLFVEVPKGDTAEAPPRKVPWLDVLSRVALSCWSHPEDLSPAALGLR